MNTKIYLVILLAFFSLFSTTGAEAYVSGAKSAEKLNDTYRLYSVDFSWSFAENDLLIPVLATRGLPSTTDKASLGFNLLSENGLRVKTGTSTAFVVANLPIEKGYYRLKAGEVGKFKLLTLHESASSTQPLKLQVSALPFKFNKNNKETKTYLHTSELKGYVTTAI